MSGKGGESMFVEPPEGVECESCGYPMAYIRGDPSAIAAFLRFECSNCDEKGTVEYRGEWSAAKRKGTFTHGAATLPDAETGEGVFFE